MKNRTLIRLVLVGDAGAGKTAIVKQLVDKKFNSSYVPTIGVGFFLQDLNADDYEVKLQIWDSAGQHNFKSLANTFYREQDVFLFAYDLTRPDTIKNVEKWIDKIQKEVNIQDKQHVVVLVGNKSDLTDQVSVTDSEIKAVRIRIKKKLQLRELPLHKKISAKKNDNLDELFAETVQKILPLLLIREEAAIEEGQSLSEEKPDPRKAKNATTAVTTGVLLTIATVVLLSIFWPAIAVLSTFAMTILAAVTISVIAGSVAGAWFLSDACQNSASFSDGSTAVTFRGLQLPILFSQRSAPIFSEKLPRISPSPSRSKVVHPGEHAAIHMPDATPAPTKGR